MKNFRNKNLETRTKILESRKGLRYRAGFTFIELVIVIAVISIMTVVALGYFGNTEQQARLSYSTDSLVSAIKEQWELSKSGNSSIDSTGKSELLCYAIKFQEGKSGDDAGSVDVATSLYDGQSDKCALVGSNNWRPREITGQGVVLSNISDAGGLELTDLELYFKPPFGYVFDGNQNRVNSGTYTFQLSVPALNQTPVKVQMGIETQTVKKV